MAVVYKEGILSQAAISESSAGVSFSIGYELSGFTTDGWERIIEALNASGIPQIGDYYYGSPSLNYFGSGSKVVSRELTELSCAGNYQVLVKYEPPSYSSIEQVQPELTLDVQKNGTASLQEFDEKHDIHGTPIRMYFDPGGGRAKYDEKIKLKIKKPVFIRNFQFKSNTKPENLAEDVIGKVSSNKKWMGWSMSYTYRTDGGWNVTFQAAKNEQGWDPGDFFMNEEGKAPSSVDVSAIYGTGGIGKLAGPGAGELNGATRPEMYETWDLSSFPSSVQTDF